MEKRKYKRKARRWGLRVKFGCAVDAPNGVLGKEFLPSIHPGEILLEEFLKPLGISQYRMAKDIALSATLINGIVNGRYRITSGTSMRLGAYFKLDWGYWKKLQDQYDTEVEMRSMGLAEPL